MLFSSYLQPRMLYFTTCKIQIISSGAHSLYHLFQILSAYLEYMTTVGVLLGGEENATRDQMKEVIEFESKIAEVIPIIIHCIF